MLKQLRNKVLSSQRQKITVSLIATAMLMAGVMLLYQSLRPLHVPNLADASTTQVVDFLSNDYANLPVVQQKQFMHQVATWYFKLDHTNKSAFEQSWNNSNMPKDIKSRITAQVRISTVNQLSSQYAQLPEADRQQFLAQVTFMMKVLPSGKKLQTMLTDKKQWDRVFENPQKYWQTKDKYAQELTHYSSAEQRAQLAQLCRDLAQYNGLQRKQSH